MSYFLNPNRRCPTCTYYGDDRRHLKACVPKRYWPEEALVHPQQYTVVARKDGAWAAQYEVESREEAESMVAGFWAMSEGRPDVTMIMPGWDYVTSTTGSVATAVTVTLEGGEPEVSTTPPSEGAVYPHVVSAADLVAARFTLPDPLNCECGYVVPEHSKNPAAALRMHQMKAKQHQRVPLPGGEFLPEAM